MLTMTCDICGREIPEEDTEGDAVRLQVGPDEFIVVMFADDDGDPTGKHVCFECLSGQLKEHDWADGIDLSSAFNAPSESADDAIAGLEDDGGSTADEPEPEEEIETETETEPEE